MSHRSLEMDEANSFPVIVYSSRFSWWNHTQEKYPFHAIGARALYGPWKFKILVGNDKKFNVAQ